jgi:hypothetical protein
MTALPPTQPGMRVRTGRFEKLRFYPMRFTCGGGRRFLSLFGLGSASSRAAEPLQRGYLMPFPTASPRKVHSLRFTSLAVISL